MPIIPGHAQRPRDGVHQSCCSQHVELGAVRDAPRARAHRAALRWVVVNDTIASGTVAMASASSADDSSKRPSAAGRTPGADHHDHQPGPPGDLGRRHPSTQHCVKGSGTITDPRGGSGPGGSSDHEWGRSGGGARNARRSRPLPRVSPRRSLVREAAEDPCPATTWLEHHVPPRSQPAPLSDLKEVEDVDAGSRRWRRTSMTPSPSDRASTSDCGGGRTASGPSLRHGAQGVELDHVVVHGRGPGSPGPGRPRAPTRRGSRVAWACPRCGASPSRR